MLNIHTVPGESDAHYLVKLDLVGDIQASLKSLTAAVARRPDIASFVSLREQRIDELLNGLAAMGASLPAAIAAALVKPRSPIVVISGDGGFLMNAQELETAKRLGLGITVIIFNDQRLSLIEKHQRKANLAVTQTAFTNPDFKLFAHSFGAEHQRASNAEQLSQALNEALESGALKFIGNSLITVDSTESTTQESRPGSGRLFRLMRNLATEKAKGGRRGIS